MKRLRRRAGFTLVEMAVSLTLFALVGYALLLALNASNSSNRVVRSLSAQGRALRETTDTLVQELAMSHASDITVSTLTDGNHRVDFPLPIVDGGAAAWGVYDIGGTPHSDWRVRYTVKSTTHHGTSERCLLRQVVNGQGAVMSSSELVQGLRSGTDTPPGLKVIKTGAVWELTIGIAGEPGGQPGMEEMFHVRVRN